MERIIVKIILVILFITNLLNHLFQMAAMTINSAHLFDFFNYLILFLVENDGFKHFSLVLSPIE